MKYRVLWSPDAESEIESILARADDRSQVTASAQLIDGRLLESPHEFGESRASGLRIGFERPLGIVF